VRFLFCHLTSALFALAALPLLAPAQADDNRNIRFGMPTPAKSDSGRLEDFLIERDQYVLSYNDKKKIPN
jgi:endonuclease G, mitochondrial